MRLAGRAGLHRGRAAGGGGLRRCLRGGQGGVRRRRRRRRGRGEGADPARTRSSCRGWRRPPRCPLCGRLRALRRAEGRPRHQPRPRLRPRRTRGSRSCTGPRAGARPCAPARRWGRWRWRRRDHRGLARARYSVGARRSSDSRLGASLLPKGTTVAGYRIDGALGEGGMGVVYRATQLSLNRSVALKILSTDLGDDPALPRALPARGPAAGGDRPPAHRHGLRHRRDRARPLPRHAHGPRADAEGHDPRARARSRAAACDCWPRWPTRSTPRTTSGSPIATSSRRTSSSAPATTPTSPTSA